MFANHLTPRVGLHLGRDFFNKMKLNNLFGQEYNSGPNEHALGSKSQIFKNEGPK